MEEENKNKFFFRAQKNGKTNPESEGCDSNFSAPNKIEVKTKLQNLATGNNNSCFYGVTTPEKNKTEMYSDVKKKYDVLLKADKPLSLMLKNIKDIHTVQPKQWQDSPVGQYLLCEAKIAAYEKESLHDPLSEETIKKIESIQDELITIFETDGIMPLFLEYDLICATLYQELSKRIDNLIELYLVNNDVSQSGNDSDFYRLTN